MTRMSAGQRRIHEAALKLFAAKGTTEVSVSELAQAAGVARGTVYNNLKSPEMLFKQVAAQLAEEMDARVVATYAAAGITDPALKMAIGIRCYLRRAHEEPHWGRFLLHFGLTESTIRELWTGPPMQDLFEGQQAGRYRFAPEQLPSAIALIGGATMSGVLLVIDGLKTWREAGHDLAAMVLTAFGMPADEAKALATVELPPLAELD